VEYAQEGQITPNEGQLRRMSAAMNSPKGFDPTVK
jgi:hypothetical protein